MNTLNALLPVINANQLAIMYGLLAIIYSKAARIARHEGHQSMSGCYWSSAMLHAGLAACHIGHVG